MDDLDKHFTGLALNGIMSHAKAHTPEEREKIADLAIDVGRITAAKFRSASAAPAVGDDAPKAAKRKA